MFAHALPLLGLGLFFLVGVVLRGFLQYRRFHHIGVVLFRSPDWRKQLRDVLFCSLFMAMLVQAVLFAETPERLIRDFLVEMPHEVVLFGALLMFAGLMLTVFAQLGMGESWRIGIDEAAQPGLVTGGFYRFCRNPIYLGMLSSLIGITLIMPTALSVLLTVGVLWCVRTQTLEEEAYLERTYGLAFRSYASRVGRFLPGLGRLSPEAE